MMRRLILSGLLALGAALAPGAAFAQSPSPQKQNDTSKAKDDYVQSVQARLTQVDARMSALANRVDASSKSVLGEVRPKRESVGKMLASLQNARDDRWMSMRSDIDRTMTDIEQALAKAPGANEPSSPGAPNSPKPPDSPVPDKPTPPQRPN